jgi:hypothetical protein
MDPISQLVLIVTAVRLFYAGIPPSPPPPPVKVQKDVGTLYVAPADTRRTPAGGVQQVYVATKERKAQIVNGFSKLKLGQTREQVRDILGPPDRAEAMHGKARSAPFHGWDYTYELKMETIDGNMSNKYADVFFDAENKLEWAEGHNIKGLHEIGPAWRNR